MFSKTNKFSKIENQLEDVRSDVRKNLRLFEGILIGRHFEDVPIVASRFCGDCSVAHNLASIKSIEKIFGINSSLETIKLRKLMLYAHLIRSHSLNLFSLISAKKAGSEGAFRDENFLVWPIRDFANELLRIIGGRTIHPIASEVGGFRKVPALKEIQSLIARSESVLENVLTMAEFFRRFELPNFSRPTEYVCLESKGEYVIYDGNLVSNKGLHILAADFEKDFSQLNRPWEIVKRLKVDGRTSYMIGAIARIHNQREKLSAKSLEYLESLSFETPDFNSFHNIFYQVVEMIHVAEESLRLLNELAHSDLKLALVGKHEIKEGAASVAVESSRGTLFYHMDIDGNGYVKNVNIITPTAQFLPHLEDDLAEFIGKQGATLSEKEKKWAIQALIQAHDPCTFSLIL